MMMTQADYKTVFEIGLGSFPWASAARPLIFVVIGALLVRFVKRKRIYVVMGILGVAFGTLIFVTLLVIFVPNFVKLRSAYVSGRSSIVEGVVENFHPAPALGPATESFSVNGMSFSYNALDNTPCFHNAPIHAGPIRSGLHVRIYYNEACIQRVDIAQRGGLSLSN
jgi:hypothetical protein